MTLNDESVVWLFAVSVAAFGVWTVHFVLASRMWWGARTGRSFQVWYIALMIESLFTSIVLGRATRVWPELTWIEAVARISAPILAWMLLSGGVVALWTWSRPERRW
jgi:hypothetical protein